jgi:hypothetical protein
MEARNALKRDENRSSTANDVTAGTKTRADSSYPTPESRFKPKDFEIQTDDLADFEARNVARYPPSHPVTS